MALLRHAFTTLWRSDRVLTGTGLLMFAALVPMLAGLLLDPRTITGAPAWLKPAKFAISTGIYSFTLAWFLSLLPSWPRLRLIASRGTAAVFVTEVVIISLQAWRGTTSHFNVATPLDAALFNVMGGAIVLQTMIAAGVAVALWRQTFQDRALGWALRLGLTIAILGASTGGLMTRATEAQRAELRAGRPVTIVGAHTVGAPDGGPGLPGTGWSIEHGDLRAAHFLGLHAMQALPALALILRRRLSRERRARTVVAASGSYGALFALLVWQALRGQSVVQPDLVTTVALAIWAAGTVLALRAAGTAPARPQTRRTEWASL